MTVSLAASLFDFIAKGKDFSASSSFFIHIFIYTLLSYITIPTKVIEFKPMLKLNLNCKVQLNCKIYCLLFAVWIVL